MLHVMDPVMKCWICKFPQTDSLIVDIYHVRISNWKKDKRNLRYIVIKPLKKFLRSQYINLKSTVHYVSFQIVKFGDVVAKVSFWPIKIISFIVRVRSQTRLITIIIIIITIIIIIMKKCWNKHIHSSFFSLCNSWERYQLL